MPRQAHQDGRRAVRTPERIFQRQVLELAALRGWWIKFEPDSRKTQAGWPDLVLLRPPRLLYRELKRDDGRLRPEQHIILAALQDCGQDARVWRPSMWSEIEGELA